MFALKRNDDWNPSCLGVSAAKWLLTLITASTFWNVMFDMHMNRAPLMFITPSWSRCWL